MRSVILLALSALILWSAPADAQTIINPALARVEFGAADQATIIPVGEANAGQPVTSSYQGMIFPLAADVTSTVPIVIGPVIPKSLVTTIGATTPPTYSLSFAAMGISVVGPGANQIPPCTVVAPATCPQYAVVLVAIGPNSQSARAVASESDPFSLAALRPTTPPAGPSGLRIRGS